MHRYVIERDLPGVGKLSGEQLQGVRETSNKALSETPPGIQWVQSLVTEDRIYCHYLADDPELVREHARIAGFPCNKVTEVKAIVDPMIATLQEV
jgi:hypothetical protein